VRDNSDLIASEGGIYTEGIIGVPMYLNPVLISSNPADKDIAQLIFSGLAKYNPHTGLIEDDVATSERSNDNLSYKFTIVPDAFWHDGVEVTADDVVFTYQGVIQNASFPNGFLKQTFADVEVVKVDKKTVEFKLAEPYSFFLANVTLGLLPKHHLEFIPVENFPISDFNKSPIGSGPYKFSNWSMVNDTHEITLKKFDDYYAAKPKISTIIFRAFADQASLMLAENTLTGFRISNYQDPEDLFGGSSRFEFFEYQLPQYSALFLNTDSDILTNKKVRFALLLATDKEEILEAVGNAEIVDTPILESKADLDIEFSLERAMGAFFDTEWNIPEKVQARVELDEEDEEDSNEENSEDESEGTGGPEKVRLIDEATELLFTIKATQDSWMSLTIDGTTSESFLLNSGDSKQYKAVTSLKFNTIGNAAGLEIDVNGLSVKKLGNEGQVIRDLLLDRVSLEEYLTEGVVNLPVNEEPDDTSELDELPSDQEDEESVEDEEDELVEEIDEDEDLDDDEDNEELEKVRINDDGERLILRLVTAQDPPVFLKVAELVQKQWLEAGAKVVIETYSMGDLQEKIKERDYDILLFGQNLGYNLDAFPFWHSSQAIDGLNLADYRSLEADNMLVDIRKTFDERTKQEHLDKLKKAIAEDTPAVFLYNPSHYYVIGKSVKNVQLGNLSNHADRFNDLINWYIREDYLLNEEFSFKMLFSWIFSY